MVFMYKHLAWLLIFVLAVKQSCNSMKFHHRFTFLWEGNFAYSCDLFSSALHSFDFCSYLPDTARSHRLRSLLLL